jgi:molybdopterin molybdotransferase
MQKPELQSLDGGLRAMANAAVRRICPETLPLAEARGLVVAEDVVAPADVPSANQALRSGYSVRAADTIDASVMSPMPLPAVPKRIAAGMDLPSTTDAVLAAHGVHVDGTIAEAVAMAAPWADVRRAGDDARRGMVLLQAGSQLSTARIAALEALGVAAARVRRPRIAIRDVSMDALGPIVAAAGATIVANENDACLVICDHGSAGDAASSLAVQPGLGEARYVLGDDNAPRLCLPARRDAVLALAFAFLVPLLDRLSGRKEPRAAETRSLDGKITVTAGVSNVALFSRSGAHWHVIAAGDLPLRAFAGAEAAAVLAPECEGLAAGTMVTAQILADVL